MRTTILRGALVVLMLALLWPLATYAQAERKLAVLHEAVIEGDPDDGLALRVYFSLREPSGAIIDKSQFDLEDAGDILLLADGRSTRAVVEDPDAPIKIVLLLDRSGSMLSTIDVAKPAATAALEQMPARTELFVYQFREHEQDAALGSAASFSASRERWPTEVAAWQPVNGAATCLYNATYQAVQLLAEAAGPAERRAIILFTDGVDERASGEPCSERPLANVIAAAQEQGVPIYTIGLCKSQSCADIDEDELRQLARDTDGLAVTGLVEQIEGRFATIMAALNSQWMARATVFPRKGANRAVLTVAPTDGSPAILGTFNFSSRFDYAPPPGFAPQTSYDPQEDRFLLTLNAESISLIASAKVDLLDSEGGTIVDSVEIPPANLGQPVQISTAKLIANRLYCLQVRATNLTGEAILRSDEALKPEDDPAVLGEICVKYEPQLAFTIAAITPNWESNKLAIQLNVSSVGQRELLFDGTIVDRGGSKIADIRNIAPDAGVIFIDLPAALRRASERDEFSVQLSTKAGGQALSDERSFSVTPPSRLSLVWPITIGALLLVAVGGAAWGLAQRWQARPRALPTPLPYNSATGRLEDPPPLHMPAAQQARASPMRAQLRVRVLKTKDPTQKRELMVDSFPFVIGRGERDTQLPIPGDDGLSRHHLQISLSGSELSVTDLKSLNGSFLGEQRLEANTPAPISGRTEVRLGPHTVIEIEPL